MIVALVVFCLLGWIIAGVLAGLAGSEYKLRQAAEQRAKDWEQRAGEAARDTLSAALYSRVALPTPAPVTDTAYDYDDTGLVRVERPASSL